MKKLWNILVITFFTAASSCTPEDRPGEENEKSPSQNETGIERVFFAKGADISWTTQMQS